MLLEGTRQTEHLGLATIYGVRRVLELDSGAKNPQINKPTPTTQINTIRTPSGSNLFRLYCGLNTSWL